MAHFEPKVKVKKTTKQVVEQVLKTHPFTRDSDMSLYGSVLNITNPDWEKWSAADLLNKIDDNTAPSMVDVVRYRQRFQQMNIDLRGHSYQARMENQKVARKNLAYGSGGGK